MLSAIATAAALLLDLCLGLLNRRYISYLPMILLAYDLTVLAAVYARPRRGLNRLSRAAQQLRVPYRRSSDRYLENVIIGLIVRSVFVIGGQFPFFFRFFPRTFRSSCHRPIVFTRSK